MKGYFNQELRPGWKGRFVCWVWRRGFWNPCEWEELGMVGSDGLEGGWLGGNAWGSGEQRGIWRDWCGGGIWRGSRAKTVLTWSWSGGIHRWAGCAPGAQNPHAPVPSSTPRRKHVAALLDIRGLHNTAARHEILAVARDLELSEGGALCPPRNRAFFTDIPVPRPSFCLGLPLFPGHLSLSRLARPSLAYLPRLRPLSPSRRRAQR